jgi:pyridoxamine 5'-phosphate oxidase
VIISREELEGQARLFEKKYRGRKVPCPPFWGGFRLIPSSIEFWEERADRLHDRVRYRRSEDMRWIMERLAP